MVIECVTPPELPVTVKVNGPLGVPELPPPQPKSTEKRTRTPAKLILVLRLRATIKPAIESAIVTTRIIWRNEGGGVRNLSGATIRLCVTSVRLAGVPGVTEFG